MNSCASNYSDKAKHDDGSCVYNTPSFQITSAFKEDFLFNFETGNINYMRWCSSPANGFNEVGSLEDDLLYEVSHCGLGFCLFNFDNFTVDFCRSEVTDTICCENTGGSSVGIIDMGVKELGEVCQNVAGETMKTSVSIEIGHVYIVRTMDGNSYKIRVSKGTVGSESTRADEIQWMPL